MQDSIQALDFLSQGFYNGRKYIFMKPLSKIKHQIKSGKYYIFWGACTIAVMAGQIYVGAGYRSMSQEVKDLTEIITIKMEWEELRERTGGIIYQYSNFKSVTRYIDIRLIKLLY